MGMAACSSSSNTAPVAGVVSTTVSGSAGDGPVVNGAVTVVDANGNAVTTTPANPLTDPYTAKFTFTVPSGTVTPLVITVSGGRDIVSGAQQDFPLTTAVTALPANGAVTGNANPLSTIAVATAMALGGGKLTTADLYTATSNVLGAMGFGLPSTIDPISTTVDATNVAQILKANEAAAEMIRRTATKTGKGVDAIVTELANDLTSGAIDGKVKAGIAGITVSPYTAAAALVQQVQVSVETLANKLTVTDVYGVAIPSAANFTATLNSALKAIQPTATGASADIAQVASDSAFLTQTSTAINVANALTGGANASLNTLQATVSALAPGQVPTTVQLTALNTDLYAANNAITTAQNNASTGTNTTTALADTQAPVISLKGALTVTIEAGAAAVYNDAGATALDNIDGVLTPVPSGIVNTTVVGSYFITYNITDAAGNAAAPLSRLVNVVDTTKPVVTAPAAVALEATGATTAVTLGAATVTDNVSTGLTATAAPAGPYAVGVHTITWTAVDAYANVGTATQTVTVTDTTAPVVISPTAITIEATGVTTAVTLGVATVTDVVSIGLAATATPVGPYAVGVHTITWTATDAYSNVGTATQTVTVIDTVAPVVTAPAAIAIEATGATTVVNLGAATVVDIGSPNLTAAATPAGPYAVGVHNITWTSAPDAAGNIGTATQTVTVTDKTAPVVTPPAAITIEATGATTAVTLGTATVVDAVTTGLAAIATPAGPYAVGVHTITWTATDAVGNVGTVTQAVIVQDTTSPVIKLNGLATIDVVQNTTFTDPGAVVTDNVDIGLTATVTGAVDTAVLGSYTLTYNVSDAATNAATPVTRTVNVIAKPAGVTLTLFDSSIFWNINAQPTAAVTQQMIASAVIAGAKIVVDNGGAAKTYTTDASGKVVIPGVDVGLHDISIFADGFIWESIYQVTFDPAKPNQFGLDPKGQQGFNNGGGNSQFTLNVNLPAVQPLNTLVELSITDAYSNVYTTNMYQKWNNLTQTNTSVADFYINQVDPYTAITGVLTAREITCDVYGMNCTETNAGNLGQVSFITQPWTGTSQASVGTVNVTYAATHVTVPAVSQNAQAVIGLNISNSLASPGTILANAQWPNVQLEFTYTDNYGQTFFAGGWAQPQTQGVFDVYGAWVGQQVIAGATAAQLWNLVDFYGNPLAVGSTVTAMMTAVETVWDGVTQTQSSTNFVNLGLQTFTVQTGPYPGFPAQPLPGSLLNTKINVAFPITPPVQSTVLSIQSIVPPVGISLNGGMGVNNWATATQAGSTVPFYNDFVNPPVVLPHVFTSYQPLTGNVNFYTNGRDVYSNGGWDFSTNKAVGSIISYASFITTPITISPYQTANVIAIQPINGGGVALSGDGMIAMYDAYTQTQLWNHFFTLNTTSITLTTPPVGIINPLLRGNPYLMDVTTEVLSGAGAPVNMSALMYLFNSATFNSPANLDMESYGIPNIPYTY